jgi:hypothetical protein
MTGGGCYHSGNVFKLFHDNGRKDDRRVQRSSTVRWPAEAIFVISESSGTTTWHDFVRHLTDHCAAAAAVSRQQSPCSQSGKCTGNTYRRVGEPIPPSDASNVVTYVTGGSLVRSMRLFLSQKELGTDSKNPRRGCRKRAQGVLTV